MRAKGTGSIFQDSLGRWTASIELPPIDGKRRRKRIRAKDRATVEQKLETYFAGLRARGEMALVDPTVSEWLTYWMRTVKAGELRPKTRESYTTIIDKHIRPVLGRTKLDAVQAGQIRRVLSSMTIDKHLTSSYSLQAYRVMSEAFEDARRDRLISTNPTDMIRAPRKSLATLEVLDGDEARALLAKLFQDEEWGTRWATSLLTGARRGEVLGLEWDRVSDVLDLSWQLQRFTGSRTRQPHELVAPPDFEYRHVTGGLYLTRPKSRAGWRVIPLVEPLRTALEQHRARTPETPFGLVFTSDGRPIDPDRDSRRWRETRAALGIDRRVRLHDLRHSAVDLLYDAGVPEDLIVDIIGHSTRAMTRSYKSRGQSPRMRAAMEQFSALLAPQAHVCPSCGAALDETTRGWRCLRCSVTVLTPRDGVSHGSVD